MLIETNRLLRNFTIADDSDHYYESMCPMDQQQQQQQPHNRAIANGNRQPQFEDDYDSFDTDNDEGTDYEQADEADEDNEDAKKVNRAVKNSCGGDFHAP